MIADWLSENMQIPQNSNLDLDCQVATGNQNTVDSRNLNGFLVAFITVYNKVIYWFGGSETLITSEMSIY